MKDLQLTGDGSVIDNIAYMESIADEVLPDYEYSRELLDEEIEHERIKYAEHGIKIEQILEEKKRVMDEINARLKVEQQLQKEALNLIRRQRMDVRETCYLVKDQHEGTVGTYNQRGEILSERRMKGTERQKSFYTQENLQYKEEKTGTDG